MLRHFLHQVRSETFDIATNDPGGCSHQSALSPRYLALLFFFILSLSHLRSLLNFPVPFASKVPSIKDGTKEDNHGGVPKLSWLTVIINHLCMIYASFPVRMHRITIRWEKLNLYAITGSVGKKSRIFIYHCWQDKGKGDTIKTVSSLKWNVNFIRIHVFITSTG